MSNYTHNEEEYKKLRKARLFVKNLPYQAKAEDIKAHFSKLGEIDSVVFKKKDKDENSEEIKGFCFVQYKNKNSALKAIDEYNKKNFMGRKIFVSLAVPKSEYINEYTNGKENIQDNKNRNKNNKQKLDVEDEILDAVDTKAKENENSKQVEEKVQKKDEKAAIDYTNLVNDPTKTIFIQGINFTTEENALYTFFKEYGPVVYAKICKNPNNTSKGVGFVMFSKDTTFKKVLETYRNYTRENKISPFELDGKYLKIMPAYDRSKKEEFEEKKKDKRNRENLLFGLTEHYNGELSLIDGDKRQNIITSKQTNFDTNPNYFVSKTRLSIRNLPKKVTEEEVNAVFKKAIDEYIEGLDNAKLKKKLLRSKVLKQLKLLKDEETQRSKVSI
jgi:nucleolar protein 4